MKHIIIACDGTWVDADSSGTFSNVARICQIAETRTPEGILQITHYDSGIGTNGWFDGVFGGYTGDGLDKNIREAYAFLVRNYEVGDKIFLIGFSRGAYTVRSLAGLIYNVGLLQKTHASKISEGFEIYRSRLDKDHPNGENAIEFKTQFSYDVNIEFLGVFDTVGALGIPGLNTPSKYHFHDTKLNPKILCARHAYGIDEIRYAFMPTPLGENGVTDVAERAFPGVHSDIGGGYEEHGLSDRTLEWMVGEACARGLFVNWDNYPEFKPDPAATMHDSYRGIARAMGYHYRHACDNHVPHLFKPMHSMIKASQYPIESGTKPDQSRCNPEHFQLDPSFFARRKSLPTYVTKNVELVDDHSDTEELNSSSDLVIQY